MPGIEDDIARLKALGFVHLGFAGQAVEYEVYVCPRSGVRLFVPLADAAYIVQSPHPNFVELGRSKRIDDALAWIAQAPTLAASSSVDASQVSEPHTAHVPAMPSPSGIRSGSTSRVPPRPTAPTTPQSEASAAGAIGGEDTSPRSDNGRLRQWLLWLLIGLPLLALGAYLLVWELLPMLLMPALFVLGGGQVAAAMLCAIAGACWGVAASTWRGGWNPMMILAAAVFAALVVGWSGEGADLLGPFVPLYGAFAAVSIVSIVLERPCLQQRWMLGCGLLGAVLGLGLSASLPFDSPRGALWLTAIVVHGVIAMSSRRIWACLANGRC